MTHKYSITRRCLLAQMATGTIASLLPTFIPSSVFGHDSITATNSRIGVGIIGKASERVNLPRSSRSSASTAKILANTPARVHCWNRRWRFGMTDIALAGLSKTPQFARSTKCRWALREARAEADLDRLAGISGSIRRHCSLIRYMLHGSTPINSMFNYLWDGL